MFKFMIVVLALIAAVMAAPSPSSVVYSAPAAYSYSSAGAAYVKPVAAVYSSRAYVPAAYSSAYVAPVGTYSAYPYSFY